MGNLVVNVDFVIIVSFYIGRITGNIVGNELMNQAHVIGFVEKVVNCHSSDKYGEVLKLQNQNSNMKIYLKI